MLIGAFIISVIATAAALSLSSVTRAGLQLPILAVAVAAFGLVLALERRQPRLSRRAVLAASAALLALAVVIPPQGSRDVWAYVMYGRIVTQHSASPYTHVPAAFPADPMLRRVSPAWRHTPSVYGPAFTAVSAAGMAVTGTSPTASRLFFQLLAAGAVAAALALLARRGADAGALAWIGLNPVVLFVVAGGHNDLLVGLAVLCGVLAATRGRAGLAGVALGLGALVKISGLLPLAAVVVWLVVRQGWRAGARAAVAGGALVAIGYAAAGGPAALEPLHTAAGFRSKGSFWVFPVGWLARHGLDWTTSHAVTVTGALALVGVAIAGALIIAGRRRDADPALAAAGVALAYLLGGTYILPWYAGWTILVTALAWRSRLALLVQIQAAALLFAYVDRPGLDPDSLHAFLATLGSRVLPALQAVAFVALVVVSARRLRASRPILGT